jgi:hypothetical protein
MHDFSNETATILIGHHPPPLRLRGPTVRRLIAAIAVCAVSAAPLQAADIRGSMKGSVTPSEGGGTLGSFGFVLEGKIEAGDYDKLRSVIGEISVNQFFLGSPGSNWFYLASPGGDLAEAMKIGRLVRALKLQTIVPSRSSPHMRDVMVAEHKLKNPKANYMCASACFFIFVAGVKRTWDEPGDPILGIHRPYLSDSDLKSLSGDQAITSAHQVRTTVENYLKEMGVTAKYADMMFSVPKDKVRWVGNADFKADLAGIIPEIKDWLAARCDKRTDVEKAIWEKLMADPRPIGQFSASERSISDMMQKKMSVINGCENNTLDELSGDAWLQMFDPTCTNIAPEARALVSRTFKARCQ